MDKPITKRSLSKEILYVFLFFNLLLIVGFIVLHLFYASSQHILECYTFEDKFSRAECSFTEFTLQASIGYLFIIAPLEIVAVFGMLLTATVRKMLDRKIKKLSSFKSILLSATIFSITWIGITILWFYSMIHKNI